MNYGLRIAVGALLAGLLAAGAWRTGALSTRGAATAFVVGWLACAAGPAWTVLLLAFFISGSALSRLPSARAAEVESVVEKGAVRDAAQVLANGGLFAIAAGASLLMPSAAWAIAAAGALAAACADTWATEVGTRFGGVPRVLLTGQQVTRGTSGAVTGTGLLAAAAGAALIAAVASAAGLASFAAVVVAGFSGALADSVLGATIQERRRCDICRMPTERLLHSCGARTAHAGGLVWMDNDVVNLLATVTGALVALLLLY